MGRLKLLLLSILLFSVSACAQSVWAPDDEVAKAAYVSNDPPSITLVTVINNYDGSGGHTGLIINASQRVAFDPAGNFKAVGAPERNDVVYGMRPAMLEAYYGFHARKAWHVVLQKKLVSAEVAERAFQLAKENGAVASGFCSNATTRLLRQVPGFESLPVSLFPKTTMKNFAKLPGVTTETIYQDD